MKENDLGYNCVIEVWSCAVVDLAYNCIVEVYGVVQHHCSFLNQPQQSASKKQESIYKVLKPSININPPYIFLWELMTHICVIGS